MNPAQLRIPGQIDDFVQAYNAGDVDRLMAVYTDDFIDMSDGEATLSGVHARTKTTARLNDTFAKYTGRLRLARAMDNSESRKQQSLDFRQ